MPQNQNKTSQEIKTTKTNQLKTFAIFLHTTCNQNQKYFNIIDELPLEIKSPDVHFSTFIKLPIYSKNGYLLQGHRRIFCNLAKIKVKAAFLATHCTGCPLRFRCRFLVLQIQDIRLLIPGLLFSRSFLSTRNTTVKQQEFPVSQAYIQYLDYNYKLHSGIRPSMNKTFLCVVQKAASTL